MAALSPQVMPLQVPDLETLRAEIPLEFLEDYALFRATKRNGQVILHIQSGFGQKVESHIFRSVVR